MKKWILFLLIACTVAAGGVAWAKNNQARDAGLRADSLEAAADTAHLLHLAAMADTINAWQRRVVQVELQRDELDRELQARPVVRVAAGIRVDTLRVVDTVETPRVAREDSVKTYRWTGRDGPFEIAGDARLFPDRGIFRTTVTMPEPVEVGVRITCAQGPTVRSASVLLTAPDPFHLVPGEVQQDPSICNPLIPPLLKFNASRATWAGAGLVAGVLLTHWLDDGFHRARY